MIFLIVRFEAETSEQMVTAEWLEGFTFFISSELNLIEPIVFQEHAKGK
jgi:hypothetical protein